MKLEKKDALCLVLSVVLSIFIIGFFVSQALSWAFADGSVQDIGFDAYANTYWTNDTHGDIIFKTSSPIKCLYYQSDRGMTMFSDTENSFIGAYWYSGTGLTQYNQSTVGTGSFTLGQDGFYQFFAGDRQLTPSSTYPIFDDAGYALQYLNGDDSVLQYALNYSDLVGTLNEDLSAYISNAYFTSLNDNTATFNIVCSNTCPEGIDISVECVSVANIYGWSSTDTGYKETAISKFPAEVLEKFVLTSGSYLDTSVNAIYSSGYDNKVPAWDGYLATPNSTRGNYAGTLCFKRVGPMGVLLQKRGYCGLSWSDPLIKEYSGGAGKNIMGSFNMFQFNCPSWSSINVDETFSQPMAYQIKITIRDNTNGLQSSYPVYLFSTIDGTMRNNWGFSSGGGQSLTTTNGNGVANISTVDENGSSFSGGNIDNSNIIPYIQSGMGLSGQNGLVDMFKEVLSFLPQEVWVMVFFALSVSVVIMIVKILRGM